MSKAKTQTGMNEHALSKKVGARLKQLPSLKGINIHGGRFQEAGIPDYIIFFSTYRGDTLIPKSLFVELKSPSGRGRLSKLQEQVINELRGIGHEVIVAMSVKEIEDKLEEMGYDSNI